MRVQAPGHLIPERDLDFSRSDVRAKLAEWWPTAPAHQREAFLKVASVAATCGAHDPGALSAHLLRVSRGDVTTAVKLASDMLQQTDAVPWDAEDEEEDPDVVTVEADDDDDDDDDYGFPDQWNWTEEDFDGLDEELPL